MEEEDEEDKDGMLLKYRSVSLGEVKGVREEPQ